MSRAAGGSPEPPPGLSWSCHCGLDSVWEKLWGNSHSWVLETPAATCPHPAPCLDPQHSPGQHTQQCTAQHSTKGSEGPQRRPDKLPIAQIHNPHFHRHNAESGSRRLQRTLQTQMLSVVRKPPSIFQGLDDTGDHFVKLKKNPYIKLSSSYS